MNEQDKAEKLLEFCKKFINEQQIYCAESVYQSDNVILNAYEFVEGICNIVGYCEYKDE